MARLRADWRARPDDPDSIFGWLRQDAGAPFRHACRILSAWLVLGGVMCLLKGEVIPGILLLVFSGAPSALTQPIMPLLRKSVEKVGPLLTLPLPATPFHCRIEVFRNGTLMGKDQGVVFFIDGWLHYEGIRTSFSMRRSAASEKGGNRVVFQEGGSVMFYPEDRLILPGVAEGNLKNRFTANLASWMNSEASLEESVLPPGTVHASGQVRAWSNLVVSCLALGFLWPSFLFAGPGWAAYSALPFLWGFLSSFRDLRRVSRAPRGIRTLPAGR